MSETAGHVLGSPEDQWSLMPLEFDFLDGHPRANGDHQGMRNDDYEPAYSVYYLPWTEAKRLHGREHTR